MRRRILWAIIFLHIAATGCRLTDHFRSDSITRQAVSPKAREVEEHLGWSRGSL